MINYLSFGGGVNSVALHLLMLDEGIKFESVFVNHGTDWPETYEYFNTFQKWLESNGHAKITELFPDVQGHSVLYDYYSWKKKIPSIMKRDCTDKFKIRAIEKYYQRPCFIHLGIDYGERHRAKIVSKKGREYRYLLIEYEIDRDGCKKIILDHGLPIPMKSGCYCCPFQKRSQWIELRRKHPDIFCKVSDLEKSQMEDRIENGKKPFTLCNNKKTLSAVVNENQIALFEEDEYPPCQCGL